MGDAADMALAETMDMEDLRMEWRLGSMSASDAFELGIIDHEGYEPYSHAFTASRHTKHCRYCGSQGLHWRNTPNGWRLANSSNVLHECAQHPSMRLYR